MTTPDNSDPDALAADLAAGLKDAPQALRRGLDDLTLRALADYAARRVRRLWRVERKPPRPPHGTPG